MANILPHKNKVKLGFCPVTGRMLVQLQEHRRSHLVEVPQLV